MAAFANTTIPSRRGFLSSLAALPMLGGGIKLLGRPTGAAVPVSVGLLKKYRGFCIREMFATEIEITLIQSEYHYKNMGFSLTDCSTWQNLPAWWPPQEDPELDAIVTERPASTRAAVVMAAIGVPGLV